jgi:altronate hydrolase
VISERDNVATALQPLQSGQTVDAGGHAVTVIEPIASGHKVSLRRIAIGEPVIKYGSPIGTATVVIEPGAHVHIHNVASSRGRGDLESAPADAVPRLAEPPDDPATRNGIPARAVNQ